MGILPAPFWTNLFLSLFRSKYIQQLILVRSKTYRYEGISRFIDDPCAINDSNEFLTLFKMVHTEELELTLEH